MRVCVGNSESLESAWPVGSGQGWLWLQSEKGFRRDQALQRSSRNQLLPIGSGKETDPCDSVVRFPLSTGSFTP